MRKLAFILFLVAIPVWAANESVTIDTKTKKVVNPVVKFGSGNTLDCTGATVTNCGSGGGGSGTVTSIATTSPITGGTITSTGTIGLNVGVDHAFTARQSIRLNDASNNSVVSALQLEHDTTGTPGVGLGASMEFKLEDDTAAGNTAAVIGAAWSDVTHATISSYLDIKLSDTGFIQSIARFYGSGGLEVGSIGTDPGFGAIDSFTIRARHVAVANAGTSSSSWTPSADNFDQDSLTALAGDVTINAPSGTPSDGKKLILRIKSNGSGHNITWNGAYVAMGVTLPATISASKTIYAGCDYNSNTSKWDVLAVAIEP